MGPDCEGKSEWTPYHCLHRFDGATGLYFCCRDRCKHVFFDDREREEKTHGGSFGTKTGRFPVAVILSPEPGEITIKRWK